MSAWELLWWFDAIALPVGVGWVAWEIRSWRKLLTPRRGGMLDLTGISL